MDQLHSAKGKFSVMQAVSFAVGISWPMMFAAGAVSLMLLAAVIGIVALALAGQIRSRRVQSGPQFWTFYRVNDRLYHNRDQKRLAWSQDRLRHHRYR